jgi:hypothetical protein
MQQDSLTLFTNSLKIDSALTIVNKSNLAPAANEEVVIEASPKNEKKKEKTESRIKAFEELQFPIKDSIHELSSPQKVNWSKFEITEKPNFSLPGLQKNNYDFDFLILPILLIFVLLIWVNPFKNKKIKQYFNLLVSNRFIEQLIREEDAFLNPQNLRLFLIYFISTSILIFNGINLFSDGLAISVGWRLFLIIMLIIPVLFFVKALVLFLSNITFKANEAIDKYSFNMYVSTKILALLLILPVIFSSFGFFEIRKLAVLFGGGIYALIYGLRIGKSMLTGWQNKLAPTQYIILYICTLEIAPFAILMKVLIV